MEKAIIDRFLKEAHKANARKIRICREGKEELATAIRRGRTATPTTAPGHVLAEGAVARYAAVRLVVTALAEGAAYAVAGLLCLR